MEIVRIARRGLHECPSRAAPETAARNISKRIPFANFGRYEARAMSIGTILLIILILLLIGAIPNWPHSRSWGYYPSGGIGVVLVIVIVLLLMGRI
jgi:hypothetical protein